MADRGSILAQRIRQIMLAPHSLAGSLAWTFGAVAVPTLVRLAIGGGANAIPFVTYFPAVVLTALFLGWRFGVLAAVLSAAAARLLFMPEDMRLAPSASGLLILTLFVLSCAVLIAIGEMLRRTLLQLQDASAREELLNAELRHRLKNLLAVVGSLASLSFRNAEPGEAQKAFSERLSALDRATRLLGAEGQASCTLPDLAEQALSPFLKDYDIRVHGPKQALHRDCCVPVVLAFHELATNAIKYGALGAEHGWVNVNWEEAKDGSVALSWREHDGPPVAVPEHRGLGSRILSMHSAATEFDLDFASDGVRCEMRLKAA